MSRYDDRRDDRRYDERDREYDRDRGRGGDDRKRDLEKEKDAYSAKVQPKAEDRPDVPLRDWLKAEVEDWQPVRGKFGNGVKFVFHPTDPRYEECNRPSRVFYEPFFPGKKGWDLLCDILGFEPKVGEVFDRRLFDRCLKRQVEIFCTEGGEVKDSNPRRYYTNVEHCRPAGGRERPREEQRRDEPRGSSSYDDRGYDDRRDRRHEPPRGRDYDDRRPREEDRRDEPARDGRDDDRGRRAPIDNRP